MKEHPILFNTEMVKAILEGRKTQTRRVIKPQPSMQNGVMRWDTPFHARGCASIPIEINPHSATKWCPYGQVGDRLWVRETWCEHATSGIIYRADEEPLDGVYSYHKWRPSIFMPRWASRINLENTEVRVERLRKASLADAIAEGFKTVEELIKAVLRLNKLPENADPLLWVIGFKKI